MNQDVTIGIKWYLVFLFSTVVHEAAHAWTALKLGDDTAARGGQVTLDPTPHIRRSPVGMVVVPIISYLVGGWMIGWASAPFSVAWARQYPRRAGLMALAGPVSNLLMLLLAGLAIRLGVAAHVFTAPQYISFSHVAEPAAPGIYLFLAEILGIFFSLNLLLCVFNLLPLPPLDGSAVLAVLLPPEWGERLLDLRRHPTASLVGMYVSWQLIRFVYAPIHAFAVQLLYPGAHYY